MTMGDREARDNSEGEREVKRLVGLLKAATTLEELQEALLQAQRGGLIGGVAQKRFGALPRFGRRPPSTDLPWLSYDDERLLVADDEGPRIVHRRDGDALEPPAPPAGEKTSAEAQEAPQEGAASEDEGADPVAVETELREAFAALKVKLRKLVVEREPGGRGRIVLTPADSPKVTLSLTAAQWGQTPAAIARGVVEAMRGGGED
jgi:hypothetical protein